MPRKYLNGRRAPLVLSVSLPRQDPSRRWKQVVEPYPGHYMHHLELTSAEDVDDEVLAFLREAWDHSG